jgi:hypothetical protein
MEGIIMRKVINISVVDRYYGGNTHLVDYSLKENPEDTKNVINQLLALYFGFRKTSSINGNHPDQWSFPIGFSLFQCGTPNHTLPDFVKILEDYMALMKLHGAQSGYPRQFKNIDKEFDICYVKDEEE